MISIATAALAALVAIPALPQDAPSPDRLYGRVTTTDGSTYEGFIRWDKNEGSWDDILNGSKRISSENYREAERLAGEVPSRAQERERTIRFLGLRISWSDDDRRRTVRRPSSAQSGLRFGHIRTIEPSGGDRARLVLRSGEEIELEGGSTDIGTDSRGIEVEDGVRGRVELEWRDIERVDLMDAPDGAAAPRSGDRLFGTLRTSRGDEFTGYVSWDVDEIYGSDVLDGREQGRDREIPFRSIAAIERYSSSSARVFLSNGEEVVLRGSNDVNESNRGVAISDPALGQVTVRWAEFDRLTLQPLPARFDTERFDGGRRLRGTVRTEDGRSLTGFMRWDNDEEFTWELLDGNYRGVEMDIEFSEIESIEKRSSSSALVRLRDGRRFELDGSNDVNEGNKGIFVSSEGGETVMVRWNEFRDAFFARR